MGTGTGTTPCACAGGFDFGAPGRCGGSCCSPGGAGAGVFSCAPRIGANSKATETITRIRFMGEKAGNLNSAAQNQDSNLNLQLAPFCTHTDRPHASRVQICRDAKSFASPNVPKQSPVLHAPKVAQIPARSRIDLSTFSASKNSRARL